MKRAPFPSADEKAEKKGAPGLTRAEPRAPPTPARWPRAAAPARPTCALPPVPGDHGLAGDRVQPGGALGLLAAGERRDRR